MNQKKKKISMLAGALAVMLAAGIAVPAQGVYAQEASPETAVLDVEDLDRLEMAAPSGKNVVLAASTVKSGSAARVVQAALGQQRIEPLAGIIGCRHMADAAGHRLTPPSR